MESVRREDIRLALRRAGLRPGQVVYIQSNLSAVGRVEGAKSREEFCRAYLDAIRGLIGPRGTVVVPTYTTQVARFDLDFVWEETPSLMGVFSEFVRRQKKSLRSLHPIHSVCALGRDQAFICGGNGQSNFGWDSPFHRLLMKKAKILTIGLESGYAVAVVHHLEAVCGLPHVYNKLLKWSPIVRGRKDPRRYYATSRYLDLTVEYDLSAWVKRMRRLGQITSARLGGGWLHFTDYAQVFTEGVKMVKEDPFFFLKSPPGFIYGRLPFDGPTAGRDAAAAKRAKSLKAMNWAGYYLLNTDHAGGDDDRL